VGCRAGDLHRICPIAPFGMRLSTLLVRQQLRPSSDTPAAVLRWLQEASGNPELGAPWDELREKDFWRNADNTVVVVPHQLAEVELGLFVRIPITSSQ
jgi:hypothetical protein